MYWKRGVTVGKLIMVTGGARSGKSSFAEETAKKFGENVLYVATSIPLDDEMKLRIKKHRLQRPEWWETIEAYRGMDICLNDRLEGKSAVLLDCITIMVTNLMFEKYLDWDNIKNEQIQEVEDFINTEIQKLIKISQSSSIPFIAVTNELGMGVVPENRLARIFRDIAGRANQMLAKVAEEVYLCVSGIPVRIKP